MKLKRFFLFTSMHAVRLALRLYGWRTCPPPEGFPINKALPFWRHAPASLRIATACGLTIQRGDFAEAVNLAIQESLPCKVHPTG